MKKLTINDVVKLRKTYEQFYKQNLHGKFVPPVSLVNNGYLHYLNASFDGILLRESKTGTLLKPKIPINFGTMQPCIRTEDELAEKKSLLHLSLFEILGYSRLEFKHMPAEEMAEKTVREFVTFYRDFLHLDTKLLRVYCFGGGRLNDISKGRVVSNEYIEPDDFSRQIWKQYGVTNLVN